MTLDNRFETYTKYDDIMETRKWATEIPSLNFDPFWEVRVVPPFGGAVIRFYIKNMFNNRFVSVYLDCYGHLGAMDEPYWEIYPDKEGDASRFALYDTTNLLKEIRASLIREETQNDTNTT